MKLITYLVCFSLVALSEAAPAGAQVTFKLTAVANSCQEIFWDIILQPGQIELKDGDGKVLSGTFDRLWQPTFRSTYYASSLRVNTLSACRFHSCGKKTPDRRAWSVSLACNGPYGNQSAKFWKQ
jgi:hypothetical protein